MLALLLLAVSAASAATSGEVVWTSNFSASFFGLPVVAGDRVFICGDSTLLCLNATSGEQLWKNVLDSSCQYADVNFVNVFVGSQSAIYAFDQVSGSSKWRYNFKARGGTPARPTAHRNVVFFTVEDGFNSTKLRALSSDKGKVLFTSASLATTRLWAAEPLLIYVEVPEGSSNASSQVLVARDLNDFRVVWNRTYSSNFSIGEFGAVVGYELHNLLVMLAPTGAGAPSAVVAVLDGQSGRTRCTSQLFGATNNLDFTTSGRVFFTIMSLAPSFTNSTLSGYSGWNGKTLWSKNLTTWMPNLVPGSRIGLRGKQFLVIVQGSHQLRAFDAQYGNELWSLPFPNPQQVIGMTFGSRLYIGNTVQGHVAAIEL